MRVETKVYQERTLKRLGYRNGYEIPSEVDKYCLETYINFRSKLREVNSWKLFCKFFLVSTKIKV